MYQDDEDEDNEASEEENSVIEDPATHTATNYICDRPEVFGTVSFSFVRGTGIQGAEQHFSYRMSGIKSVKNMDYKILSLNNELPRIWLYL